MGKGYVIGHVHVEDMDGFSQYRTKVGKAIDEFDGKIIVKSPTGGDVVESDHGSFQKGTSCVVVEFPSFEVA